jgi:hypothetical protein
MKRHIAILFSLWIGWLGLLASGLSADAHTITWHPDRQTLDVDVKDAPLIATLEEVALKTGWHIYLEPTPGKLLTAKFSGLPRGLAMQKLIGDQNYAFVPADGGPPRLFIFRTSREAATYEIKPKVKTDKPNLGGKPVPNQLIVKLRPGVKIEDIAAKLGAKVKARIGDLNAYLLEFENEAAVEAARKELASNGDVESTDSNYYVDAPPAAQRLDKAPVGPPQLQLNPPPADGRVIVGLVDTAVQAQSLPAELQKFLLQQISVAGDGPQSGEPAHGTSMAETLLRALQTATSGRSSVQILPVDVYGPNANATTFDVANGIIRAVNGGATIVNLSLGSDAGSPFLHSVITDVTGRQIAIFGAAGNTPVTTPFYPAAYPEVIAVTAANNPGQLASYANRGSFVDMIAPGNSVVYFNGQPWLVSGTSAASAYAAGLAAGIAEVRSVSPTSAANTVMTSLHFTPPK